MVLYATTWMDDSLFLVFPILGVALFRRFIYGFKTSKIQNHHQTRTQWYPLFTSYICCKSFSMKSLEIYRVCEGYRIYEEALVYFWYNHTTVTWGTYVGLTSAPWCIGYFMRGMGLRRVPLYRSSPARQLRKTCKTITLCFPSRA